MKQLFLTLILSAFAFGVHSQSVIDKHYKHLEKDMDATVVFVSGNLFNYVSKVMPEESEDLGKAKDIMESIESFQLISSPNVANPKAEYMKGLNDISQSYDPLVLVRDKGNNVAIYIDEENDIVREIVGLISADSSFVVFSLLGEMDLNKVSEMIEEIQKESKLPFTPKQSEQITSYKVYPNPIANGSAINIDVPADMIGGTITLADMSGRVIQTTKATSQKMQLEINGAYSGSHLVEISKGEVSIKKQVLVIE